MHHEKIFKLNTVVIDNVRAVKVYRNALDGLEKEYEAFKSGHDQELEKLIKEAPGEVAKATAHIEAFIEKNKKYIDPRQFTQDEIYHDECGWGSFKPTIKKARDGQSTCSEYSIKMVIENTFVSAIGQIKALLAVADMALYPYAVEHDVAANLSKMEVDGFLVKDMKEIVFGKITEAQTENLQCYWIPLYYLDIGGVHDKECYWHKKPQLLIDEEKEEAKQAVIARNKQERASKTPDIPSVKIDKRSVWKYIKDCFKGNPEGDY